MKRWIALFFSLFVIATTSRARAEPSVVGRSDRHVFGTWGWDDEPMRVSVGAGIGTEIITLRDTSLFSGSKTASVQGPSGALDGAKMAATFVEIRPRYFVGGPLYVGPAIGAGPSFSTNATSANGARVDGTGFFAQIGGAIGARVRPWNGFLSLSLETIFGARVVLASANVDGKEWTASYTALTVQPRLQIDGWTTAWSTVGVWIGADALHDHDVTAGIAFALHVTPYDENPPGK